MYCRYITCAKFIYIYIYIKTYPGVLKTVGIGFGIRYGHMPYTSAFESVEIGIAYASTFKSPGAFKFYSFKTYSSTFESTGICSTYSSAFKSVGIGYIHISVKAIPTQVKTSKQGLKSVGIGPATLYRLSLRGGLKC